MTPVFQSTAVDCLSAAVASVLDLPLSEVPVWWDLVGADWITAIMRWAESRGVGFCYFSLKDRIEWPHLSGFHLVVAGETPRSSEYLHAVVARAEYDPAENQTRLHWVHDPLRGGEFITDPDHCLFFIR